MCCRPGQPPPPTNLAAPQATLSHPKCQRLWLSTSSPAWRTMVPMSRFHQQPHLEKCWAAGQGERVCGKVGRRGAGQGSGSGRCGFLQRPTASLRAGKHSRAQQVIHPLHGQTHAPAPLSKMLLTKPQLPWPCCSSRMRPPGRHTRAISCAGSGAAGGGARSGAWRHMSSILLPGRASTDLSCT